MRKGRSSTFPLPSVITVTVFILLALVEWSSRPTIYDGLLIFGDDKQLHISNTLQRHPNSTSNCSLSLAASCVSHREFSGGERKRQGQTRFLILPNASLNGSVTRGDALSPVDIQEKKFSSWKKESSSNASLNDSVTRDVEVSPVYLQEKESSRGGKGSSVISAPIREGPYHHWELFRRNFAEMLQNFRVYVYPDVKAKGKAFSKVFIPHENPFDPKLGNYFSEHMFKINLLKSSFLTSNPDEAHLFYLPFSVNVLRNDPRVRTEESIAEFVAQYVQKISLEFEFWNRTEGADHFYACCHSVGRDAASRTPLLQRNSMQVVCSSSYYYKSYFSHKDVAMPQVWPRSPMVIVRPPHERTRLAFFAGRARNSRVRERLLHTWKNDSDLDIHAGMIRGSYEDALQKSKFCLHVKGYEVNTARISDAIHFGCVPVIISDHYDLPFANVLDWEKFSIILSHVDIPSLKNILLSISSSHYRKLHENVCQVREHFQWQVSPFGYDSFYMTMYQLWLRQAILRPP